ncbi:MAG: hypothetical protein ACRD3W_04435, partial [Terriglobales bacterium]
AHTPKHPLSRLRCILEHIVSTLDFDALLLEHVEETKEQGQVITPSLRKPTLDPVFETPTAPKRRKQKRLERMRLELLRLAGVRIDVTGREPKRREPKRQEPKRLVTAGSVIAAIVGGWILFTVVGMAIIMLIGEPGQPLQALSDSTIATSVNTEKKPLAVFMYRNSDKSSNELMSTLQHVNAKKLFWKLEACDLDSSSQLGLDYKVYAPCVVIFIKGKPIGKLLLTPGYTSESLSKEIESTIFAARRKQAGAR